MIVQRDNFVLGADGCVEAAGAVLDDCCAPPICGTAICGIICSFINLLPQGPLWDYWKQKALAYYQQPNPLTSSICDPLCVQEELQCPSLVQHAIYSAFKLQYFVQSALWQVLREGDPTTAETTVGSWLETMQWQDCYAQHCRAVLLDDLSPYEIAGACGEPVYCPPAMTDEQRCALDRAILIALARAEMGIIRNLCSINWVIEPLGARVQPRNVEACADKCCECEPECLDNVLDCVEWEIIPISLTLPGCVSSQPCDVNPVTGEVSRTPVPAFIEATCESPLGTPRRVWPAVVAAECIVRSLMPQACPKRLFFSCSDLDIEQLQYMLLEGDEAGGHLLLEDGGHLELEGSEIVY